MIRIITERRYKELLDELATAKAGRSMVLGRLESAERMNQVLRKRNVELMAELEEARQVELVR